MMYESFDKRLRQIITEHEQLLCRKNETESQHNGIFQRYKYPILTAAHTHLLLGDMISVLNEIRISWNVL